MKARSRRSALPRVQLECQDSSLTHQSFKENCDINNILKKYESTGLVEHLNNHNGNYGNFLDAPSYQEALNHVINTEHMFNSVPANIRAKFNNDPAQFLEFVQNPDNKEELISLGLAKSDKEAGVLPQNQPEEIVSSENNSEESAA